MIQNVVLRGVISAERVIGTSCLVERGDAREVPKHSSGLCFHPRIIRGIVDKPGQGISRSAGIHKP